MTTKPNLPGCDEAPATSTPRGSNRALNCAGVGVRAAGGGGTVARLRDRGARPGRRRRSGRPSGRTISGLTSTLATSLLGRRPRRGRRGPPPARSRSTAASPRNASEQALGRQLVDHLVGRDVVERRRAEHDVGDRLGEDAAEAEHHRRPELRVAQHAGDQLAVAADHRRDEQVDVAVVRRGGGQQLGGARRDGRGVGEVQPDQAPLGLVGDGVAVELGDHREPELGGGGDRVVGRRRPPFAGNRHPEPGEQLLRLGFGQGARRHRPAKVPTRAPSTERDQCPGGARPTHWAGPACTSTDRGGNGPEDVASAEGGDGSSARRRCDRVRHTRRLRRRHVGRDGGPLVVGDVGVQPGQREADRPGGDGPQRLALRRRRARRRRSTAPTSGVSRRSSRSSCPARTWARAPARSLALPIQKRSDAEAERQARRARRRGRRAARRS